MKSLKTCKSLGNLQELYSAVKEKHPNVNIVFSNCVVAGSKLTHSVCVCSAYQNVVLLVNVMD